MLQRHRMQIAGEFCDSDRIEVIKNPYDGEPVAEVAIASAADMDRAIDAASRARTELRRVPTHERARLLEAIAVRIEGATREIAELIARESGKPIRYARAEVTRAVLTFRLSAGESRRLGGEVLPTDLVPGSDARLCLFQRVPRGPVAAISPFNFPLNLVAHKLGPSLAVGAPMLLKPAPQSPITAHVLGNWLLELGAPAAALSVLHCSPEVAERMVRDDRMSVLSFTGSDSVGWRLKSIAGKKHVLLELGGNAPCIVDAGVDLDRALPRIIEACWANAGQVCIKAQRLLIHRSLFSDFLSRFVDETARVACGNPLDENTVVGPLIEPRHVTRVLDWIAEARAGGAEVLTGGSADGQLVLPTVLTKTQPNMRVCRDEVFGPVTVVEAIDSFDDALAACNQSRFGLQAGVFTPDIGHALRAFESLDYGGVLINDTPMFRSDNYPYGGNKDSGIGREGVRFAIEELSEPKALVMRAL